MRLTIGDVITERVTFTQAQFDRFAALSGDDNPIHVDPAFAAQSRFGRTVAHGMFLYANLRRALGKLLPGVAQREGSLMFTAPTYTDEPVQLRLEVVDVDATGRVWVNTTVVAESASADAGDGQFGCRGDAIMQIGGGADEAAPAVAQPSHSAGSWRGLVVGQSASLRRAYTTAEHDAYLALLGETNPLFSDATYARRRGLRGLPLPGPLLGALFSCVLGTRLPGRGTNWLKQRFYFCQYAFPGDELEAHAQIIRLRPDKELVNLRTWITSAGELVCDGEALVWVGDLIPQAGDRAL
ncbi:MAG: hypothetical protein K1X50_11020 [Candidatus Promineofilum sp.]|nr:hypothetical protein [Promineifilum sp.]MCW5862005.1 oxidoreductase [Anaerolineae bacterium]